MGYVGASTAFNDHPTFSSNTLTASVNWPAGTQVGDTAFAILAYPYDGAPDMTISCDMSSWTLLVDPTGTRLNRVYIKTVNSLTNPAISSTETGSDDTIMAVVVYRDLQFDTESHVYFGGANGTAGINKLVAGGSTCVMMVAYASGLSGSGTKAWTGPGGLVTRVGDVGANKSRVGVAEYVVPSTGTVTFTYAGGAVNNTLGVVLATTGYLWQVGSVRSLTTT